MLNRASANSKFLLLRNNLKLTNKPNVPSAAIKYSCIHPPNLKTAPALTNYGMGTHRNYSTMLRLDPTNYKQWTKEEVCSLLQAERPGANLDEEKVKELFNSGFDGSSLDKIIIHLNMGGSDKAFEFLVNEYPNVRRTVYWSIVYWVEKLVRERINEKEFQKKLVETIYVSPKYNLLCSFETENAQLQKLVSRLVKLNVNVSSQDEILFVTEKLVPFIQDFEKCIKEFEQEKAGTSKADFNLQMKKLGLANENTHIYIKPKTSADSSDEENAKRIVCSFAPTFPEGKYKDHEAFLRPLNILAFGEVSGSGKTHFAYHLTNSNRLVAPITVKHVEKIYPNLEMEKKTDETYEYRRKLNIITATLSDFYLQVVILLDNYAEKFICKDKIKSETLKQYILRFLWNRGAEWVSSQDLKYKSVFSKEERPVMWFLDDAQDLCSSPFNLAIPQRRYNSGNLLTLLSDSLRHKGSVVLTTSLFSCVDGKIESIISRDAGKADMELFSHQLNVLPQLNPQQVLLFLKYFITIPDNDELWEYVSFMLQGNIGNCEAFLQQLYVKASSCGDKDAVNAPNFIYDCVHSLFEKTVYSNSETELNFERNPRLEYEFSIYKLATTGEVSFYDLSCLNEVLSFLIRNRVSFTIEKEKIS